MPASAPWRAKGDVNCSGAAAGSTPTAASPRLTAAPVSRRWRCAVARLAADGRFFVSTRRGKQFNSMVQRDIDPLTGAGRDEILISEADLARAGPDAGGDRVRLRSATGTFEGRLRPAPIRDGNLEVHWPEGNVLLAGAPHDPESLEPDYNAVVTIEPAGA